MKKAILLSVKKRIRANSIIKISLIIVIVFSSFFISNNSSAQQTGSFSVGGDVSKYYPVTFVDGNWNNNRPTELTLGRSGVHLDVAWRGSLLASFKFHASNWGNSSEFIYADIYNYSSNPVTLDFIGGWIDATPQNADSKIVIWLRGGNTTYYYSSNTTVTPEVYDGVQRALPFHPPNGPDFNLKATKDFYVNISGINGKSAWFERLSVYGDIKAKKIKITQSDWPDYVFEKGYKLRPLNEVEKFLNQYKHLPDVQSADDIEKNGLDLGDSQSVLLRKIEELTLYLIEQNKKMEVQEKRIKQLELALKK